MKEKVNYLNVGCGNKYHPAWTNIDMNAGGNPDIIPCNLLKGIPFRDNQFEVVYHSQVLEHIPKEDALHFMKECYRVLKSDGFIRVVVPDLENIVDEYKKWLHKNVTSPDETSELNYDWIMLELFDQTIRNKPGGLMSTFLRRNREKVDQQFIINRIGFIGQALMNPEKSEGNSSNHTHSRSLWSRIKNKIAWVLFGKEYLIGKFRLGGEIHYWMYDRYSLSRLLRESGFKDIRIKTAFESDIDRWAAYELDVKNGMAYDPASLFIEARK